MASNDDEIFIDIVLIGTDGDDFLVGGAGWDRLEGRGGNDRLVGNGRDDMLLGGGGDDVILGNQGDDLIRGGTGRDRLFGGQGDDVLYGGAGADFLSGDRGDDLLYGGPGADTFRFDARHEGTDTIADFDPGDILSFARFDLMPGIGVAGFRFEQVGTDVWIYYQAASHMLKPIAPDWLVAVVLNADATLVEARSDFSDSVF